MLYVIDEENFTIEMRIVFSLNFVWITEMIYNLATVTTWILICSLYRFDFYKKNIYIFFDGIFVGPKTFFTHNFVIKKKTC